MPETLAAITKEAIGKRADADLQPNKSQLFWVLKANTPQGKKKIHNLKWSVCNKAFQQESRTEGATSNMNYKMHQFPNNGAVVLSDNSVHQWTFYLTVLAAEPLENPAGEAVFILVRKFEWKWVTFVYRISVHLHFGRTGIDCKWELHRPIPSAQNACGEAAVRPGGKG